MAGSSHVTSVECCDHENGVWQKISVLPSDGGGIISGLSAGHTYSFRLGESCQSRTRTVTIPHESRWQQEQFEHRYLQLHTIGRGRTAVVRVAQDRGTGQRVALKQVSRRKIPQFVSRAEYNYLTTLSHCGILRGLAMFENAPLFGVDTIVMELLHGEDVLTHACSLKSVSESHIRLITSQLLSALDYLQLHRVVHCDIKPNNLVVECNNNKYQLKIVDFGSAYTLCEQSTDYQLHLSVDLEFSAPELLGASARPTLSTDVWSCAVLVYVFVSGVSPFLDDSPEETISHILNADFSFPPELFPSNSRMVQEFVSSLFIADPVLRPLAHSALSLPWLHLVTSDFDVSPALLASFIDRRKPLSSTIDFLQ